MSLGHCVPEMLHFPEFCGALSGSVSADVSGQPLCCYSSVRLPASCSDCLCCSRKHRRSIDPVVETVVAGLCSDHYKAFVVDTVNAVIIQNSFDISTFFPSFHDYISFLWNSISQGKGRSFVTTSDL